MLNEMPLCQLGPMRHFHGRLFILLTVSATASSAGLRKSIPFGNFAFDHSYNTAGSWFSLNRITFPVPKSLPGCNHF